ncbi:WD40-repeat-containing domain protein [Myxozyma melibiosi]|uniref:WD40-repeat-containing domain protein n=1 Tax=Myxozyma melibiosi TaxID=54550 RepID=A0ABR1FCL8_9ASCO
MPDYKLSRSLESHSGDVRGVIFPAEDLLASVSRDCTLRVWKHLPGSAGSKAGVEWTSDVSYQATKYLNSIAWMSDQGLIACAGLNQEIVICSPNASLTPESALKGHEANICSLHYSDGVLISGSWDKTARVWIDGKCKYILKGHEQAVWAVLVIGPDSFLTGAADKTIRLWSGNQCVSVFRGHTDVVRSICMVGDDRFASSSNDGSIRIWDFQGNCLQELYGHTSFVYSLAYSVATDEIISSGEDRSVRVWKAGECVQSINLPCISVWSVAVCPANSDIAVGGSDKIVRIFSRNQQSWATPDELAKFEEQVAGFAISTNQVGDINKEKIPGLDALQIPGKKIGQVIMAKSATGGIDAYQWSGDKWDKIGEVVSGVGQQQKQLYNGQEYDYVFDVDVKEGSPPLKLPYNANENPYTAAQRFLEKNELPQEYLDETAKFIEKNTAGVQIGTSEPVRDPYSDRSGSGSTSTYSAPKPKRAKSTLFPQKTYLYIKKMNVPMFIKKTKELNASKDVSIAISDDEFSALSTILTAAESGIDSAGAVKAASAGLKIAKNWPANEKLGGLDVLRTVVGQIEDAGVISEIASALIQLGSEIVDIPNNAMMAARVFVNMFENEVGRVVIQDSQVRESVLDSVRASAVKELSKMAAVALSTLILNFSVLASNESDPEIAFSVIGIIPDFITLVQDSEAGYRLLIAFGTLLSLPSPEVKEAGRSLDGEKAVSVLKVRFPGETRILTAVDDVLELLK